MKKSSYKIVFNLYSKFFIIFLLFIFICMITVAYLLKISIGNENSWSSEPISITANFSKEIYFKDGKPQLRDSGIDELKKHKLCFQIVDKNGDVATGYNMPTGALLHYAPIEMVQLYKNDGNLGNYTMFVGSVNNNGEQWTYIIGFPAKISKITMYLNYDKTSHIKFVIVGIISLAIVLVGIYAVRTNRALSNIIAGIRLLASNSYTPMSEKGVYSDVYTSLNILDSKLKSAEVERKTNETLREEWIANISHDLKTPLSPIKGYAEILIDSEYTVTSEEIKKYGAIILKNVNNVETIVKNLNFTYQLKNGMIPINRKEDNISRLLKEVVIGILNDPKYVKRTILFYCAVDRVNFKFDSTLLKRAFTNLLFNAVVHNDQNTIIKVSIEETDKIYIKIEDNGKGMEKEALKRLFDRYYRGTNSAVNVKGSGLGMAIAKQIIEAHEGQINVESELNVGTSINIEFHNDN